MNDRQKFNEKKVYIMNFFRRFLFHEKNRPQTPQLVEPAKAEPPDKPYMRVGFATDTGKVRDKNEDNFYIDGKYSHVYGQNESDSYIELSSDTHVFGLFDGMGGEAFGETASALAARQLDVISDSLRTADTSELPYYMDEFARRANNKICDMLEDRNSLCGGTTFTALCIKNGCAYPFYLGDSRIYIYENGSLLQITEDQTLAVRKVKAGIYSEEDAKRSPDSHKLTCFLGADVSDMGLDCQPCMPIPVKKGLTLMMCSDGLYDMCSRKEIEEILSADSDNPAYALVCKALENGGADNVTCITLQFDDFLS